MGSGSSLTREERIDRQERDTGDPEAEVVVRRRTDSTASARGAAGSSRRAGTSYHSPDCTVIRRLDNPQNVQRMTREAAKRRWLAPCKRCILAGPYGGEGCE